MVTCKDCALRECAGHNGTIVCDLDGESHEPGYMCKRAEPEEQKIEEYRNYVFEALKEHPEQFVMTYKEFCSVKDGSNHQSDL